ncbi:MAG: MFS transporter [Candidatus Omnitrophota bacterium]|nr:MFS transporter [Candidatus Omnitrophota bacterium]MBU1929395.1 MFS transporter [Candidatus Omnitrophota bacterium]MBU2034865.1 MFS transporter [Candidatus Omnitrophota bacterium]MBU2258696.1 MFS transporter [Candidatus Omnitrophota bacterium]
MSHFRKILKNRNFFLLWIGQIISQLGDRLGQMALIALVYSRTPGSAIEIAKILSFTIIPVFIIGPIAGVYVDRWNRRRVMYTCDLLRAALVLTIPLFLFYSKNLTWVIYLIIFLVFSIGRFFVPAKLSIIPDLVDKKDLLMANSLVNTTGMIAAILGFGVSGVIVEWVGAKSGFYLDSLSFLISGLLIFSIVKKASAQLSLKEVSREIVDVIKKSVFAEIKEGTLYFIRNKNIRFTTGIIFTLWSALGAVYVVIIVFVQKNLHSATKDLGLLAMFLGVGLLLGSLAYGRFGQKLSQYKIIFISLTLTGIILVAFAIGINSYPYFPLAMGLSLILGLMISPIMIASNTIIHRVSENHMMGKIFSSMEIVMHLGFLIFMFISSLLADKIPPLFILTTVGGIITTLGIINLIINHKLSWLD